MPSHDWDNDQMMSRDRDDWRSSSDYRRRERGYGDRDERGAFFDRDRDYDRDRNRPMGGWGGLMGEERHDDRYRSHDRDRGRDRYRSEDRRFPDDYNRGVPMNETERLIASNKVEGTPVYDRNGDKLGSIHNFMVDKRKGHVVYAVLKHSSGFLGLNERYYPLEWDQLDYDTRLGGYHVGMTEEDLKSYGSFDSDGRWHSRRSRSSDRDRDHYRERSSW